MTMTTETETHEAEHGMSNAGYVRIALILAAITALEVSTYYVDFGPFFMPSLMIMMVIKFVMVVSYFMHLKFEGKLIHFGGTNEKEKRNNDFPDWDSVIAYFKNEGLL